MILTEFRFVESKLNGKDDNISLDFAFLEADVVNLNKRKYPLAVVSKAVADAQKRLKEGASLYGGPQHPKTGSMELNDVSHLITKLWMRENTAFATARILPTTNGKNLTAILKGGGRLGVSARGHGSLEKARGDYEIVKDDYELCSVDFVCSPSFDSWTSLREEIFESVRFGYGRLNQADLKARYEFALSAGYRGSFLDFVRQWERR